MQSERAGVAALQIDFQRHDFARSFPEGRFDLVSAQYLQHLHDEAAPLQPAIRDVLQRTTPEDKHLLDLLERGYLDARHDKRYRFTAQELTILEERVRAFAAAVERVCLEKIERLRADAEVVGSP